MLSFDVLDLIGNIGGTLGLLLGWSLLNMVDKVYRRCKIKL